MLKVLLEIFITEMIITVPFFSICFVIFVLRKEKKTYDTSYGKEEYPDYNEEFAEKLSEYDKRMEEMKEELNNNNNSSDMLIPEYVTDADELL